MRQLTALDAQFLNVETPTTAAHVAGLAILDSADGAVTRSALAELLLDRIHFSPALSLRLAEVPLGLDHPYWAADPGFDLDHHLFELTLPEPGDHWQLADAVAQIHARHLDRAHPLWEMHLINGLFDGKVAVYTKVHHAAIDGVSGAETLATLLDLTPDGHLTPRSRQTTARNDGEATPGAGAGTGSGLEAGASAGAGAGAGAIAGATGAGGGTAMVSGGTKPTTTGGTGRTAAGGTERAAAGGAGRAAVGAADAEVPAVGQPLEEHRIVCETGSGQALHAARPHGTARAVRSRGTTGAVSCDIHPSHPSHPSHPHDPDTRTSRDPDTRTSRDPDTRTSRDPDTRTSRDAAPARAADDAPSVIGMLAGAAFRTATHPVRAVQSVVRAAGDLDAIPVVGALPGAKLVAKAARMVTGDQHHRPELPSLAVPRTPLNGPISARRHLSFGSLSLKDVKNVAKANGMSVNDVVMTLCTSALRSWLRERDALPEAPLIVAVPVAVRRAKAKDLVGNQISAMVAPMPTNLPDPMERLQAVVAAMGTAKRRFALAPATWLGELCSILPAPLTSLATPAIFRLAGMACPPINLIISNVPGPQFPLYMCGGRVLSYYPLSVLTDMSGGLNITCFSYDGMLDFGIVACPDRVDDVWGLLDHLRTALDELLDERVGDEFRDGVGVDLVTR
ncbi:WS/DGAT/MGAT family acyltransferase [Nonomuraea thailandensis]|uniref:diacylglycerol O-acyltransferase n=1 Tax=Nonomuraea thailandensis TaxID=1188745 RepID=A0A9X2GID0_9ACTN|nr:wax ester/triacylglycerol synthase domain-containing protein [Nonomuraea thailandensis]MCP2354658.1 WS/DGAT/MGAT family acyltransferase [Nonomuraea thailandensis]